MSTPEYAGTVWHYSECDNFWREHHLWIIAGDNELLGFHHDLCENLLNASGEITKSDTKGNSFLEFLWKEAEEKLLQNQLEDEDDDDFALIEKDDP